MQPGHLDLTQLYVLACGGSLVLLAIAGYVVHRLVSGPRSSGTVFPSRWVAAAAAVDSQVVRTQSTLGGHVSWAHNGRRFTYFERNIYGATWSGLAVQVPGAALPPFQVRPRNAAVPFPTPPGRCRQPTGLPEFDDRFEIRFPRGVSEGLPALGEGWYHLVLIANLVRPARPVLEVQAERVRLYLPGTAQSRTQDAALIAAGTQLLDLLLAKFAVDVHAIPEALPPDAFLTLESGAATCPVCCESIRQTAVQCARCRTPHHRECWDYAGTCAMYACQGTEEWVPAP